ncbi:monooxygenase fmaE [Aspergillus lucknowensis]|uniref:Monooxygenase n=1 Tax=Aspergillus lucknowensis TaxID=176173 RepID=A0ABR4M4X6_9EURO
MPPLKPLVEPMTAQPESLLNRKVPRLTLLANNFQFSTWLLAAAFVQGLITWLFPTAFTFIPALLILGYRGIDVLLITYGYRPNRYMDGVITSPRSFSAQIPDETGDFGDRPSRDTVVVLLLGTKSNHPLGILYPAFIKTAQLFEEMVHDLEEHREEYTYLTSTSWISNTDPNINAAREIMTIFYFRSMEGVHKFAHGPIHRRGWDWWNRTAREHPDISIMHEVYEAPAGCWENVYENYRPVGLATARFPMHRDEKAPKQWIGTIVDATKANMRSASRRLGRT